jgi:hypothetical protein
MTYYIPRDPHHCFPSFFWHPSQFWHVPFSPACPTGVCFPDPAADPVISGDRGEWWAIPSLLILLASCPISKSPDDVHVG